MGINDQLHARERSGHCGGEKNMLLLSGIKPLLSTPQPVILFRQNKRRCLWVLWRGSAIKKRRRKWIKIAAKWKSLRDYVQMINERPARVKPIWNISRISEFIYAKQKLGTGKPGHTNVITIICVTSHSYELCCYQTLQDSMLLWIRNTLDRIVLCMRTYMFVQLPTKVIVSETLFESF
jgi:hypothetical protein